METHRLADPPAHVDHPSVWESPGRIADRTSSRRLGVDLGQTLVQGLALGLLVTAFLLLLGIGASLGVYAYYARDLPSPHELYQRTTPFTSTKISDRHGRLLYEIIDPLGGRRTVVPYDEIPAVLVEAIVATEDETFFANPGVNPIAVVRSVYLGLRQREIVGSGSTITQQLVKNVYLTPERTIRRKLKEAILAAELTRRYSKTQILEIYLNEVYFGNLAYGVGAAAEVYFGKHVSELTLPEAALLAGLLQSPASYDPHMHPDEAKLRRANVLRLMHESGFVTLGQRESAQAAPLFVVPHAIDIKAPHMVMYVRQELERLYGSQMLYRGGLRVYTTLDLDLQYLAEQVAREKIDLLMERRATNAALVALDPHSGDVLAMLGSVDFYREPDGQVNVAMRLRQPGSTIKPFTYLAALERGWTASTMLMDVEQEFPDGPNARTYAPVNYDGKEWGAISLRTALACSRNIPAVSTLYQIGLPALLEVALQLGIHSLDRPDYGLSLTLGGGDVTLLELSGAYGSLANGGRRVEPRVILRIETQEGEVILRGDRPNAVQVMDPRHAYLVTHILSDSEARARAFGRDSTLDLSFPAAAKTGTTDGFRDSWTIGYTAELLTGVWVGNNDNSPMDRLTGSRGAGLIWNEFMERALATPPHADFQRPEGLVQVEVCPVSGGAHTDLCPPARTELFLVENRPSPCQVHVRTRICRVTGKLASQYCPADSVDDEIVEDLGPEWDAWMLKRDKAVPPREPCALHTGPAHVAIELPREPLAGVVQVRGSTEVPGFAHYVVEFGRGESPSRWTRATPEIRWPIFDGVVSSWDTRGLDVGVYAVRILVWDAHGQVYEARAVAQVGG